MRLTKTVEPMTIWSLFVRSEVEMESADFVPIVSLPGSHLPSGDCRGLMCGLSYLVSLALLTCAPLPRLVPLALTRIW